MGTLYKMAAIHTELRPTGALLADRGSNLLPPPAFLPESCSGAYAIDLPPCAPPHEARDPWRGLQARVRIVAGPPWGPTVYPGWSVGSGRRERGGAE
jgi:hypothetical protein